MERCDVKHTTQYLIKKDRLSFFNADLRLQERFVAEPSINRSGFKE